MQIYAHFSVKMAEYGRALRNKYLLLHKLCRSLNNSSPSSASPWLVYQSAIVSGSSASFPGYPEWPIFIQYLPGKQKNESMYGEMHFYNNLKYFMNAWSKWTCMHSQEQQSLQCYQCFDRLRRKAGSKVYILFIIRCQVVYYSLPDNFRVSREDVQQSQPDISLTTHNCRMWANNVVMHTYA